MANNCFVLQGLCPGPTVLCGNTKILTGELSISKEDKAIKQELERSRKQGWLGEDV